MDSLIALMRLGGPAQRAEILRRQTLLSALMARAKIVLNPEGVFDDPETGALFFPVWRRRPLFGDLGEKKGFVYSPVEPKALKASLDHPVPGSRRFSSREGFFYRRLSADHWYIFRYTGIYRPEPGDS